MRCCLYNAKPRWHNLRYKYLLKTVCYYDKMLFENMMAQSQIAKSPIGLLFKEYTI